MRRIASLVLSAAVLASAASARAQDPTPAPAPPAEPAPAPAEPAPPAPSAADKARLDEIEQRALIAERKLELIEEDAARLKSTAAVVAAGERGFNIKSADGLFTVRIRGLVHADGRQYFGDNDTAGNEVKQSNTFLVRRARPLLEATFGDVADFRLMPDFGGGAVSVQDAYIDLRPFPYLKLRAGKFKPPVGLERLQSASAIIFAERGFPTLLAPNRDVGFQLHGAVGGSVFTYELGLFNGTVDGGSADGDNNYAKDAVARLFFTPWKSDPYSALANLGVGIAATIGGQRGAVAAPGLPQFRTPGQNATTPFFFRYLAPTTTPNTDNTVVGRGRRTRLAPQGYFYYDAFGLLGEYTISEQSVVKGANVTKLTTKAWQAQLTYVIGGKALFEGSTATTPLHLKTGTLGAFELSARYNGISFDGDAFPLYADETVSARGAHAFAGALTWHWNKNIKVLVVYEATTFNRGAKAGNRPTEHVLFERVQAAF